MELYIQKSKAIIFLKYFNGNEIKIKFNFLRYLANYNCQHCHNLSKIKSCNIFKNEYYKHQQAVFF